MKPEPKRHFGTAGLVLCRIVLLITICAVFGGCWLFKRGEKPSSLSDLPYFRKALDKTSLRDDVRGKVILVEFWSRLCSKCGEIAPVIQRLQDIYRDEGFIVISVNQDGAESESLVREYMLSKGANYSVIFDESGRISDEFRVTNGIPALYLFNAGGRLIEAEIDINDPEKIERLDGLIREALKRRNR